ncbi:hypothetical protein [Virgibacillus sp.]|uniref:hypothetical protein n=1 Tax=Virgibacillus sp. TaxID=1872700 RepID=UPI0017B223CB|nr:hypothetical protein [Virgibacillus sp.]NWO12696.1 hypothetical protein [Virgibacillus sp.]
MRRYFTTVGLHDGDLEMEILINSIADTNTKEKAEEIATDRKFDIGYLYEDKLVFKGGILTIKKGDTDKYQFKLLKEWKPVVNNEDMKNITWEKALKYLTREGRTEGKTFPFALESLYYGIYDDRPFSN